MAETSGSTLLSSASRSSVIDSLSSLVLAASSFFLSSAIFASRSAFLRGLLLLHLSHHGVLKLGTNHEHHDRIGRKQEQQDAEDDVQHAESSWNLGIGDNPFPLELICHG